MIKCETSTTEKDVLFRLVKILILLRQYEIHRSSRHHRWLALREPGPLPQQAIDDKLNLSFCQLSCLQPETTIMFYMQL